MPCIPPTHCLAHIYAIISYDVVFALSYPYLVGTTKYRPLNDLSHLLILLQALFVWNGFNLNH